MLNTVIINQKEIAKSGLFFGDFCLLLNFLKYKKLSTISFNNLIDDGLIVKSGNDTFEITKKGSELVENVLSLSYSIKQDEEKIRNTVETIFNLYPDGIKPDTTKYWRGNKQLVTEKLKRFMNKYNVHDNELIVSATMKYLDDFEYDTTLMRTLPNFIEKEGESDLLTVIQNLN